MDWPCQAADTAHTHAKPGHPTRTGLEVARQIGEYQTRQLSDLIVRCAIEPLYHTPTCQTALVPASRTATTSRAADYLGPINYPNTGHHRHNVPVVPCV